MKKKTSIEMERANIVKVERALTRLKYSLMADAELNAVLPDTLQEFDARVARGDLTSVRASLDAVLNAASD